MPGKPLSWVGCWLRAHKDARSHWGSRSPLWYPPALSHHCHPAFHGLQASPCVIDAHVACASPGTKGTPDIWIQLNLPAFSACKESKMPTKEGHCWHSEPQVINLASVVSGKEYQWIPPVFTGNAVLMLPATLCADISEESHLSEAKTWQPGLPCGSFSV